MKGILADVNIQGHVDLLVTLMRAEPWKLFWDHLQLQYFPRNTPSSLPVFTIANVPRMRAGRDYVDRIIDKLLDSLQRIENLRGTGRLFLP